jgi:hypothetical protein
VFAADGAIGTWMSGAGPSAMTYVFKTHDNTFIGKYFAGRACPADPAPGHDQKSNCAPILKNRAVITDVGVSHWPVGLYVWLYVSGVLAFVRL